PSVSSVYVEEETIEAKRPERKKMTAEFASRKPKIYPEEVNHWADFIEGRTNRKPKTLISANRSEKAANKPIIEGKCNGLACRILCDSGAEVNVIDEAFVREIQAADAGVIISKARKAIKCANNSAMLVVGSVRLRMSFAAISDGKPCTFLIVKNLFPKVILGIRSMKELEMTIDPPHSQVIVKGKRIPFLSKVYAETVFGQGNEDQSVLGVGGRQIYA
ncbi:MAG: retropepsin-like aspartic protease, partial [Pseudomonadota bacterium]